MADFLSAYSIQHWLESAPQGYLMGTEFGHPPGEKEPEGLLLEDALREQAIRTTVQLVVGERCALEGAGGLIQIAPNRATKVFLATQTVDEARHLEVLTHRLRELGVSQPDAEIASRAGRNLLEFKRKLLQLVRGRDWVAAVFAQNVILEAMEFSVFHQHSQRADPRTREVLIGIIKDERRHIGFGENELGRRLHELPLLRERLVAVREELDPLVLRSFEETMDAIGTPRGERADLGRSYLAAVERLGFG